ncbi:MAG: phosphatidylglycerophosphatase A [bacterium]
MKFMLLKIRELCFKTATLGPLGHFALGGLIATLCLTPLLYLIQILYWFNATLFWIIAACAILSIIFTIHYALAYPTDKDSSVLVLDRALGFIIVFWSIPLGFKIISVGFFFFTLLNFLRPFILHRLWDINLERLPGALGVLAGPTLTGLFINLFFQLVFWIAK